MESPSIAEKYTLLRRLGKGGMAEVFLARQSGLRGFAKLVVLKRILPDKAQNGDFVTMFLDEARVAADLRHPNVINVFDINRADGTYYMAMEFLHGRDVRDLLKHTFAARKRLPLGVSGHIAAACASGLHYAHQKKTIDGAALNIVHRDISPQNVILGFSGETKIADFGIAKAERQVFETRVGRLKGKYGYMAPEHARGEQLDGRADQYALAVVLWEMLTSRRLFRGKNVQATLQRVLDATIEPPRRLVPDIPKGIDAVVMKALSKERDDRFSDCDAFRIALEDELARAKVPSSSTRLSRYLKEVFGEPEGEAKLSTAQLSIRDVAGFERSKADTAPGQVRRPVKHTSVDEEPVRHVTPSQIFPESIDDAGDTVFDPRGPQAFEDGDTVPLGAPMESSAGEGPSSGGATSRRLLGVGVAAGVVLGLALGVGYALGRTPGALSAEKGVIVLRTIPGGASVRVGDERLRERTPVVIRRAPGTMVRVEASLEGFAPAARVVETPAAGAPPVELSLTLTPAP